MTKLLAACCGILLLASTVAAQADDTPTRIVLLGSDLFAAGSDLRIPQNISGDALLAGRHVDVNGTVGGDLAAAGETLRIEGTVTHNVFGAAHTLELGGTISGNARLAGTDVHLAPSAHIGGGVSIAASELDFDGQADGYLSAAAAVTHINGHIAGDVHIVGNRLELGPNASIDGLLDFRGRDAPVMAPSAHVGGGVHFTRERNWRPVRYLGPWRVGAWLGLIGWMILGAIILALWPSFTRRATRTTANHVGSSLLLGLAVLIVVPIACIMLLITLVGIPLALLLACAYMLLWPLGYLTAAASISDRVFTREETTTARRALLLALTLLILFFVTRVPILGGLLRFLLLLIGIGGLVLTIARARTTPAPT